MRFLVPLLLLVVSVIHTALLAGEWPEPLIRVIPAGEAADRDPLFNLISGFVVGYAALSAVLLLRAKRVGAAASVVGALVIGGALYSALPVTKVFAPSLFSVWMFLGIVAGGGVGVGSLKGKGDQSVARFHLSLVSAGCIAYNILLLIAPSCVVFPTGFAGDVTWAHDTLILRHEDSVSIHNNLLFIIIRKILDPIVGSSMLANSLVSIVMASLGLGMLAIGVQLVAGTAVAIAALALAVSERWTLVTAYAGNLPASLILMSGLLFYITMRVAFDPAERTRSWHTRTFVLLVLTTLVSLYSYAAVRMPFVLSILAVAVMYAARTPGSFTRRVRGAIVWVLAPVVLAHLIMGLGPYKGKFSGLKHDLFVSWPKDLVVAHPGPEGLRNYELVRSFDHPIWQQIARPADGANKSVMWTKTPLETLSAIGAHVKEILNNVPELFFVQPLPFLLCLLGVCTLPLLVPRSRIVFGVAVVWSALWLATFLLVPDHSASRRAVAFPGVFAACVSLALLPILRLRFGRWIVLVSSVCLLVARLPHELAVANLTEARVRMFTLCATAPAHRALLTSAVVAERRWDQLFILPNGINGGKEGTCFDTAVRSVEWQRIMPKTTVLDLAPEQGLVELEKLPPKTLVAAYCNGDSKRAAHVEMLCNNPTPKLRPLGVIPNVADGAHWVVFETPVS